MNRRPCIEYGMAQLYNIVKSRVPAMKSPTVLGELGYSENQIVELYCSFIPDHILRMDGYSHSNYLPTPVDSSAKAVLHERRLETAHQHVGNRYALSEVFNQYLRETYPDDVCMYRTMFIVTKNNKDELIWRDDNRISEENWFNDTFKTKRDVYVWMTEQLGHPIVGKAWKSMIESIKDWSNSEHMSDIELIKLFVANDTDKIDDDDIVSRMLNILIAVKPFNIKVTEDSILDCQTISSKFRFVPCSLTLSNRWQYWNGVPHAVSVIFDIHNRTIDILDPHGNPHGKGEYYNIHTELIPIFERIFPSWQVSPTVCPIGPQSLQSMQTRHFNKLEEQKLDEQSSYLYTQSIKMVEYLSSRLESVRECVTGRPKLTPSVVSGKIVQDKLFDSSISDGSCSIWTLWLLDNRIRFKEYSPDEVIDMTMNYFGVDRPHEAQQDMTLFVTNLLAIFDQYAIKYTGSIECALNRKNDGRLVNNPAIDYVNTQDPRSRRRLLREVKSVNKRQRLHND